MEEMDKILACSLPEYPKGTFPGRENEGQEKKEEAPEGAFGVGWRVVVGGR